MSYYSAICGVCQDKQFIKPGTENDSPPRHDGHGYEFDGSQTADASRLDADHRAVPVDFRDEATQRRMLTRALSIIRDRVPGAATVTLQTSDQDDYGFVLDGVQDEFGGEHLPDWDEVNHPLSSLRDDTEDEINDLSWDGVVGEDDGGYAAIDLRDYFTKF